MIEEKKEMRRSLKDTSYKGLSTVREKMEGEISVEKFVRSVGMEGVVIE